MQAKNLLATGLLATGLLAGNAAFAQTYNPVAGYTNESFPHRLQMYYQLDSGINPESKNYVFYIVGRNSSATNGDLPVTGASLVPLGTGRHWSYFSTKQNSPSKGLNKNVTAQIGLSAETHFDYKTVGTTYYTSIGTAPLDDVAWTYMLGETFAYLNVFDGNTKLKSVPCKTTNTFKVGQSIYIHFSWNTSLATPTYACRIDVY